MQYRGNVLLWPKSDESKKCLALFYLFTLWTGTITWSCQLAAWHATDRLTCLADSIAWQTRQTVLLYKTKPMGSTKAVLEGALYSREACRETQTSIRLASHLVRAPNSRSGNMSLNPLCGGNLVHWLKVVERPWRSGLSASSYFFGK